MQTFLNLVFPFIFLGILSCVNSGKSDAANQAADTTSETILAKAKKIPELDKSASKGEAAFVRNEKNKQAPKPSLSSPPKKDLQKVVSEKQPLKRVDSMAAKSGNPSPTKSLISKPKSKDVKVIPDHTGWDYLLRTFVSDAGKVNYAGIKTKEQFLDNYLKDLKNKPPQKNWSRNEKMAFWINAYNAFTVKLIVDSFPLSSIMDLHGGKPWDVKWIELGGKKYSLNNIENDILRSNFKEPRIHFAVNCAANSCPPLLNKAWTPNSLERYFVQQAIAFINNPTFNKISSNQVQISKIFEWYAADFGNPISFMNKYSKTKINSDAQISYLAYDWSLNKK